MTTWALLFVVLLGVNGGVHSNKIEGFISHETCQSAAMVIERDIKIQGKLGVDGVLTACIQIK